MKTNKNENCYQLYRIAKEYYLDGLTQEKISVKENISRPHVSRLLERAKELGIVNIEVKLPKSEDCSYYEKKIKEYINLDDVFVCPVEECCTDEILSLETARFAGSKVLDLIKDAKNVGIGWGYSLYQTAKNLSTKQKSVNRTYIPLVGLSGTSTPYFQINIIANDFAEKTKSNAFYTTLSILQSKDKLNELETKNLKQLEKKWNNIDAAIIGIGRAPTKDNFFLEGSEEYNDYVRESGTIGDVLGNFFFENGKVFDTSDYYFQVSYPIEKLINLNNVICIAAGDKKVDALIVAGKKRIYKKLITDINTAKAIVEKINKVS